MPASKSKNQKKNITYSTKYLNLKNLLFLISGLIFIYYSARIIFKPNISQYPALNSCFVSTVHKVQLCNTNLSYVNLNAISNHFIHSVLISEDDSFYLHKGIDWNEFKNSFIQNLKLKKFSRGGSTITQQLVKNAYLTQNKSVLRKFKEILLAQQVEKKYPKSTILEKYLNVIELGNNIFGVKTAASYYFNKSAANLNILEAIYLTTLLPNPKIYSKSFINKKLPKWQYKRIEALLKKLLLRKRISKNLYQTALSKIHMFPWADIDLLETEPPKNDDLDFLNNLPNEISLQNNQTLPSDESEALKTNPKKIEELIENNSFDKGEYSDETVEVIKEIKTEITDRNKPNSTESQQETHENIDDSPVDTSDPDF